MGEGGMGSAKQAAAVLWDDRQCQHSDACAARASHFCVAEAA